MPLLRASKLSLSLPDRASRRLLRAPTMVDILKGVDLELGPGESVGIVGESGSGKTSLGRTMLRLYEPTGGQLTFDDQDITHVHQDRLRPLRDKIQMIFQDPQSSLNPRHRIEDILAQPLLAFRRTANRGEGRRAAARLLERVHLPPEFGRRYPHELSGGQRQRIGIARALALEPKLIVADEILSGLDVSTQAQILTLLREIKAESALILISHDLSVVRVLCDRVLVLYRGAVVESGTCAEVFARPRHVYTKALLSAIPLPELDAGWITRSAPMADEAAAAVE
jgi:peptide/nickel transport system ATP-binding protein